MGTSQSHLLFIDPHDVKKLLDWFSRAMEKAGDQIKQKTQDVIGSAQLLLQEVDKEREKEVKITEGVMIA